MRNETDTRVQLIDPALASSGWATSVRREVRITDGRVFLVGDEVHRRPYQQADYVFMHGAVPIAVLEAKDETHAPAAGLQQAKEYARLLNVPFAFSSNGHGFVEYDTTTRRERLLPAFPSPSALVERWSATRQPVTVPAPGDPLLHPYWTDGAVTPRYYQDVAVRESISAFQAGRRRILLTMATGTGKTFVASQLVWKLYQTKSIRRMLFIADRVQLRDQAYNGFSIFGRGVGGDPRSLVDEQANLNRDLYFAIYQQLFIEKGGRRIYEMFPRDFFDLVVVDECHRSGFGTWRGILDYFGDAVHIGLTATPRRNDNIDTYAYFGDPVYTYSLGQGIDDGFLATYKVHNVRTTLNERGGVDVDDAIIAGAELFVPDEAHVKSFYALGELERKIMLPDWTAAMCDHLARLLAATDPLARTIVFCQSIDHALEVRRHLQNAFAHLGFDDYAVRIVSEERDSLLLLERFRSSAIAPVVATTVDLLTTGVDIPSVRNVVFMKAVGSVVLFKQAVGRGTRLDAATGKNWFRVIDYVNATRLFDPWDRPPAASAPLPPKPWLGEVRVRVTDAETGGAVPAAAVAVAAPNEQVPAALHDGVLVMSGLPEREVAVQVTCSGYRTRTVRLTPLLPPVDEAAIGLWPDRPAAPPIRLTGLTVNVTSEIVLTIDVTGVQLTVTEYYDYVRQVLLARVGGIDELRSIWVDPLRRHAFLTDLEQVGVHADVLSRLQDLPEADAFDLLAALAFGGQPRLREERVQAFLNQNVQWLEKFDEEQRAVLLELLDVYLAGGADQLDDRRVFALHRFERLGGVVGVVRRLGSPENIDHVLGQLRERLYAQAAA